MPVKTPAPKRMRGMEEITRDCTSDSSQERVFPHTGQRLCLIPFARIRPFRNHPFRLYSGERLEDMVESIRQNGILTPLIVRSIHDDSEYDYEMLAGHNRTNAGILAGLTEALCLVKEDISNVVALMYVIETNLMQRSFTDLLPSEKAGVLAVRYSEMFSQGKRNDIIWELRLLENPNAVEESETCGTEFHKSTSRDALGQEYGLTGRMVATYLRIHKLIEDLKYQVDLGKMNLAAAASISYLSEGEQTILAEIIQDRSHKMTDTQAVAIRKKSESGGLDRLAVSDILNGCVARATGTVRIRKEVYAPFFSKEVSPKEVERIIAEALQLYFEKREECA